MPQMMVQSPLLPWQLMACIAPPFGVMASGRYICSAERPAVTGCLTGCQRPQVAVLTFASTLTVNGFLFRCAAGQDISAKCGGCPLCPMTDGGPTTDIPVDDYRWRSLPTGLPR